MIMMSEMAMKLYLMGGLVLFRKSSVGFPIYDVIL